MVGHQCRTFQKLIYLAERWNDERAYEDINRYRDEIRTYIPTACNVRKRPFGFSVKCTDGILIVKIKLDKKVTMSGEFVPVG